MRIHVRSFRIMIEKSPGQAISNGKPRTSSTSMLRLSVGILLVSLSVLCGGAHAQCTPCPSACTCTHIAGTADDCTVNCTNGNIEWIPTSSELPTADDIRILDMSFNIIEEVYRSDFQDMTNLREVYLQGNTIYYAPGNTFDANTELTTVDLSNNKITEFHRSTFSTNTRLTHLNISYLELRSLSSLFTSNLVTVTSLDVSNNQISSLDSDIFDSNGNLEYLDIAHNNLTSLPSDLFDGLYNLETLNISYNHLSSIPSTVFDALEDLRTLIMGNNQITGLSNDVFDQLSKLRYLDLSGNSLQSLSGTLFLQLSKLETLYFGSNSLSKIHDDAFSVNRKLRTLDLGNNAITSLSSSIFSSLTRLETLILQGNQLTTMDSTTLTSLSNLLSVDLSDNPWDCTCSFKTFRDTLVTLESNGLTLVNRGQVTCASSPTTSFLDNSEDIYWFCKCNAPPHSLQSCLMLNRHYRFKRAPGPSSYGSCYEDEEADTKYAVFYQQSYSTTDQLNCTETCFDQNLAYAVLNNSVCLCGYNPSTSDECLCNAKPYTPGDNIQCSLTSGGTQTKTFLQGVYRVESGLTLDTISGVTAGSSYTFIASVVLRTITKFKWSFGDSSSIEERITSSTSYNMPHTYPLPGVYDLTVGIESTSGGTDNGTIKVHVDPATSSVDPVLTCPSYINYESSLTGVTVSYGMANALEYSWTRSPDDNVTSTVGGDCDSGWTVFNGRCIQFQSTTENYADATTTCGSDATLLTIHYPNELTSIVSSYSLSAASSGKILLDARKNGDNYYWTNGNKAYFQVSSVTNAGNGDCVYIDITTSTLHGLNCATSANFICQKKPIECPHGGTAYGTTNMCYVLQSTSSAWTAAQTSCQSLSGYAQLAKVNSAAIQSHVISVLGATTEVWVGLTDRSLEGYMEWADYTSKGTYPSVSAETKDCYSLSSSGTWTARKCSTTLPYVCQYSVIRGSATGYPHVYGTTTLATSYTLVSLASTTATSATSSSDHPVLLFPGMWINGGGRLRSWNFKTAMRTSDVKLVFQVYEPSCSGGQTFIKPGCDGNGAQFGSCVASGSCSAASSCGNNEEYCYISQSCQPKGDPCNCVGRSDTFCNTLYKDSSPTYTLMGQTFLDLPAGGSEYFTVNADNIDVSENYVIAFQTNSGSDIIQCDTNTGSTWAQSALQVLKTGWMSIGDSVTAGTLWKNNTACYFQAIVAGTETESLPASLQYFSKPDTYTYTVSAPSLSIAKSCDVKAEEQIGDIEWIHPVVQSTSGSSDTIYVQHDQATYLVFAVTRGSHLTTEFDFGSSNVTGTFQAACPSTIESAFPSECNATNRWPDLPFAYEIQTFNFTSASSVSLTLKVKNDVSTDKTKSITILVFMPIIGLNIDLSVPNSRNIVEMGTSTQFTVTKTSGNPTSYRYMVNGTVESTAVSDTFAYTFPTKDTYLVEVEVSDGLNTATASITVDSKQKAQITGLDFDNVPDYMVINTQYGLTVTGQASAGVTINTTWTVDNVDVSTATGVSATSISLTTRYTFTATGNFTLNISVIDEFFEEVSVQKNIEVLEVIPSISVTASNTLIKKNDSVTFTATVPSATHTYGDTRYTFDFKDGTIENNITSNVVTHRFETAGTYNVSITVANGVGSVSYNVIIDVQEMITDLALTGATAVLANVTQQYTATYTTGTNLQFVFEQTDFGISPGASPSDTFSMQFTALGTFNITVRVFNDIDSVTTHIQVSVITADTLQIRSVTHDRYKAINEAVSFTLDVLHYNTGILIVTWDFGDGSAVSKGTGLLTNSHTYTTANEYNVTLLVQDTSQSTQDQTYSPVTAQEKITGLSVSNDGPGSKNTTNDAVVIVSASVTTGTMLQYLWTYDGNTQNTGYTPQVSVSYSTIGSKTVTLNVSNEVSEDYASTMFNIQASVEGLSIACASCVQDSDGNNYIEESTSSVYTASITAGSDLTFNFDFNDGTTYSGTTQSYSHTYSTANYTLTVTASNAVSSLVASLPVSAQSAITSLTFPTSMSTITLINSPITYTVTVTGGSDINYNWKYCDTCSEVHSYSNSITNYAGYANPDYYNVSVVAYNMISSQSAYRQLIILRSITAVTVTTDLVGTQYAEKGVAYILSCEADSTYPIIFYYWKTKYDTGSYSSETRTQNLTYTFPTNGTYYANCRATNLFTTQQEEITIYCQERITSPTISPNQTGTIGTGSSIYLEAQTTTGSDMQYAWSYEFAGVTNTLSSTSKDITFSFTNNGTYVFKVNISNNVGYEVTTYTLTVMEVIDGIGIDSDIGSTSPYLAKDTTVTFTLTIQRGESYTTQWSVKDSTPSTISTGNGNSISYQFTTPGTYTVDVVVTNQVSSKDTQLIVYVQVPLSSLSVSASSASIKTTEAMTFSADHNTDATDLTYTWIIEGVTTSTVTSTKQYTFNTPGTYTVQAIVNNNISNYTASTSVLAQDAIQGLNITGCDITAVEDTNVPFTGSVTRGTDVMYVWTASNGFSGTGSSVSAVFADTGDFLVTVNASNVVDTAELNCQMEIIGIISNIQIINQASSIYFTTYQVSFLVDGHNLVGVTYTWTFTGPTTIVRTTTTNLHAETFTVAGNYTLTLNVSNLISSEIATTEFTIRELTCAAHSMTTGGLTSKTIFRSDPSVFEIVVDTNSCDSYKLAYTWTVYQDVCSAGGTTSVSLPSSVFTTSSKFIIPGQTLTYGNYCVKAESEFIDTPLKETVEFDLTIIPSDPVALLAGGSRIIEYVSRDIELDGSQSFDPDNSGSLQYSWACSVSPSRSGSGCDAITGNTSNKVTMTSSSLSVGETYTVQLTVSITSRTSSTVSKEILISSDDVPQVSIECVSCQANTNYVLSQGVLVMLRGFCSNCGTATLTYRWTAKYGSTSLMLDSTTSSTLDDKINLVIDEDQLPDATTYSFKLVVEKTDTSGTVTGYSEIDMTGNTPPSGGSCSLSPMTAKSLEDKVTFTCTGYSDSSSSNILFYRVVSYSQDTGTMGQFVVLYYGSMSTGDFYVAPWPASTGSTRTSVKIKIFVEDISGGVLQAFDQDVTITSPTFTGTKAEYIWERAQTTLANLVLENNPTLILQYSIALAHEINEESKLSGGSFTEMDIRTKVRTAVVLATNGLPLETLHEKEQMAFILEHITNYPSEYQIPECQNIVLAEIDTLKNQMSTSQGSSSNEILTNHLLAATSNLMTAANIGFYNASAVTNATKTLETSMVRTFVPKISTIDTSASSLSAQDHKINIVTSAHGKGEDIVTILMRNRIIGQEPKAIELSGIKVQGNRVTAADVTSNYQTNGLGIEVQSDTLDGIYSNEVIQVIMGITECPFTWDFVNSFQINSQIMSMSFKGTDGSDIRVSNLATDREVKFYLPDASTSGYTITGSTLYNSTGYNPTDGITYTTLNNLRSNKKKKINIDTSQGSEGLAFHVQLRILSILNASAPAGTTPTGEITFYLGKGYEASPSSYEQVMVVEEDNMAAGVNHTTYTMFISSSDFDPSATYSISVYNNDANFAYNISVGIYFTSCQYYDTSSNQWRTDGCYPTEESIPTYAVCKCNHLTAFGGGMLVPPSAISFSDIINLDFTTNPVVFITCSIIFVVYVVAVFICRKLDKLDLEKMATIPLCGKDGSFKYEVTVVTGRQTGAGTTAHIGIKLTGEYGNSKHRHLAKHGAFCRNSQDSFIIAHDTNLGNIHKILVWHDNYGLDPSWYLTQIIVRDLQTEKKYYFFANSWLSLEMDDGYIQKELKAAGSSEIQRFSRVFGHAMSNAMADRHLWVSIMDRMPSSRFTRVQRATVCVTLLYAFMGINAIWYGILKTNTKTTTSDDDEETATVSTFGWEEVVLALVTNFMVFPLSIILILLFKKSKAKVAGGHGPRPVTAQTIEIENAIDNNSHYSSFRTASGDDILSYYDRESTTDSFQQVPHSQPIRRTRTMKTNTKPVIEETSLKSGPPPSAEGAVGHDRTNFKLKRTNNPKIWNQDAILDNWPNLPVYNERMDDPPPKTPIRRSSVAEEKVKDAADEIMTYLDNVERDCMEKEATAIKQQRATGGATGGGGGAKPLTRKPTTKLQRTGWEDVDDLLHPDDAKTKPRGLIRRVSSVNPSSKPNSSQSGAKGFTPRQDATISKVPSFGSNKVSKWVSKLRPTMSVDSIGTNATHQAMPQVEPVGPLEPDMTMARSNTEFQTFDEMEEELPFSSSTFCCTLPSWCVYIGYVLCFMIASTFIIIVLLYGQEFGAEIALKWLLALIFSLIFSFFLIEPVKALFIALYMAAIEKKSEDTDDVIVPTYDASNERVKESKFKPLGGFALMNAKDDGQKVRRMRLMLRQFLAYMFYLWLIMALCYIYFPYHNYLLTHNTENTFVYSTFDNTDYSFKNMTSISDFWSWSKTVLAGGLHQEELSSHEEYNTLLGVARMRQVRGLLVDCPASEHTIHPGVSDLIDSTCRGSLGYTEDTYHYGYWWNLSQSQNLSWRYYSSGMTGNKRRFGNVYSYGGGGYLQNLGSTYNDTLSILEDLENREWIDLRTRAVFVDFTVYSGAEDITTFISLMVEFPLSGALNATYDIQTHKMLRFVNGKVDPYMVCEVILFALVLYYTIHLVLGMKDQGCKFFKNLWNWFELLTVTLTMVAVGLYMGCVITATDVFQQFLDNRYGFTNFETVSDIHTSMRHLHAWLLFFIMLKVVKQIRFIKFLHLYEKTLTYASPKLAGVFLIFLILYLDHGMIAYLFYGRKHVDYSNYWTTLTSILGLVRGTYNFQPLLDKDEIFTHCFLYIYYAFSYGLTIALIVAILTNSYKFTKSQMYYKATLDMQDYEMIEFMMKRFRLWAGIDKPKPEFRKVHFKGLPSVSDRCSTSQSNRSISTDSGNSSLLQEITERNINSAADQLSYSWEKVLKTMAEVEFLDDQEEHLMHKTQKEIDEWKFQSRIRNYESERQGLLTWQKQQQPRSKIPHRTMTQNSLPGKADMGASPLKPTNSAGGRKPEPSARGRRPLSDGGRIEQEQQIQKPSQKERLSVYNFFKSVKKPSKDAWNK